MVEVKELPFTIQLPIFPLKDYFSAVCVKLCNLGV